MTSSHSPIRPAIGLAVLLALSCSSQAQPPINNKVAMKVTDVGFEPQDLRVHKSEPVTLVITRVSDVTCATEIVIDEYGIKTSLPLNQAVTVAFTPTKSGTLKYGCAMQKMVGGVIKVE